MLQFAEAVLQLNKAFCNCFNWFQQRDNFKEQVRNKLFLQIVKQVLQFQVLFYYKTCSELNKLGFVKITNLKFQTFFTNCKTSFTII